MGKIVWTADLDEKLRKLRDQHAPWDEVEDVIGIGRSVCVARAKELGLPTKRTGASPLVQARRAVRRK